MKEHLEARKKKSEQGGVSDGHFKPKPDAPTLFSLFRNQEYGWFYVWEERGLKQDLTYCSPC